MENFPATAVAESSEILSWEAIRERHPNEWVILVDLVERDFHTVGGRVYAHGPDKDALIEAGRRAAGFPGGGAVRWTGEIGNPRWTWMVRALRKG